MPVGSFNGVELYYDAAGAGEPLVLVHGSWVDHHHWDAVAGLLAEDFCVVAYDRRGHSASAAPPGQGTVVEDADDLVALIEGLGYAPAHVVGNSSGAVIALRAAIRRPEMFRTLIVHEPPLFPLLAGTGFEPQLEEVQRRIGAVIELLERGDHEAAARLFVDTIAIGPGAWETQLPALMREIFVANAQTWLDETRDPEALQMDLDALGGFDRPALLTSGTDSAPFFVAVVDLLAAALPRATRTTIDGADHLPHVGMPDRFAELVRSFAHGNGEGPAVAGPS